MRVTGGTATSSGREEAARGPGGAEVPGWKLQESVKSGVVEETMSAMEKLAKEIDEPDKLRIEGESEDADEKNTDGNKSPDEVFDEREDTDERVKKLHTEMCKMSKVSSVKEGHDVDGRHAPQNDETAGVLKHGKGETSADLTALEKKGLDRKTNHKDLMKIETEEIFALIKATVGALKLEQSVKEVAQPRPTRPPPWRDKCDRGESMVWLAPSYMKYEATIQVGVMNFMRLFNDLERVEQFKTRYQKHCANYEDELELCGSLRNQKQNVAKLNTLNPEPVSGITSMMEFCQVVYDRLNDKTYENDGEVVFDKVSSYGRSFITMKVQAVDDEGNKVSLDESVFRMKCGHPGNFPLCEHTQGVQDSTSECSTKTICHLKEDQSEFCEEHRWCQFAQRLL